MRGTVKVKVRLFTGLDKDAGVDGYDPEEGLTLSIRKGTRVKKVVKMLGLPDRYGLVYFINGERVGLWKRLEEGDEIACLRPSAGG